MRRSWSQPSLSRDFALLSAAILFILFMISAWVTYVTYTNHTRRISTELDKEATRIEYTLAVEMQKANYMLNSLGKQVVLDQLDTDLTKLARVLKSFDSKDNLYSLFSWIGPEQHALVSSNRGVIEKPVDISDRDYVKRALTEPWRMNIGRPIEGRVSNHWVIPVAIGITDYTGKFIGTLMISLDISVLTERLTKLIKREGISFAIVSKTLIPLAQVSDDKDFMNNHFPMEKLVSVNFAESPRGLFSRGQLFWGTGTYAFYYASKDYPYIILVGYDSKYSDEAVRNMLWSRLLQMVVMALFFVLFLWIVRARMITPVLDMTSIVSAVASGKPYTPLPHKGPIEIEGLAQQVKRVGEYIEENKRIEDEMRHKMFMLRKDRERVEMEKRSMTEFLAYVCQELSTPLGEISNAAQAMKDQLYGPIENRKYRQFSQDIYHTSNMVMDNVQDLQLFAKASIDYIDLVEKTVEPGVVINKALRFAADRLQVEKLATKVTLQEPMPRLLADEFRLQQIIMNLLLYAIEHAMPQAILRIDGRLVAENRDRQFVAITISSNDTALSNAQLVEMADRRLFEPAYVPRTKAADALKEQTDLRIELAKILVQLHHGALDITYTQEGNVMLTVMFGVARIRNSDN